MQMFRHHSYVMWVNPIIIAMSGLCGMRAQMRLQIQIWFGMFTDTNTDALLTALSNPCLTAHLGCGYQSSVEPAVFALGRIITWVRRREKEGDCIHPKGLTCSLISLKWLKAQPVNLSCNSKLLLEKRGKLKHANSISGKTCCAKSFQKSLAELVVCNVNTFLWRKCLSLFDATFYGDTLQYTQNRTKRSL